MFQQLARWLNLALWKSCRCLPLDERQSAAELDAVLQHHHNLQEKLADDMLNLARNLKNNTLAAQNIIKQDNQVVLLSWNISGIIISYLRLCNTAKYISNHFCKEEQISLALHLDR